MGRVFVVLASFALGAVLAAVLDGPLTIGSMAGWFVMFSALFGPMYLFPRQYAEWTRRCRFPRLLRPRG